MYGNTGGYSMIMTWARRWRKPCPKGSTGVATADDLQTTVSSSASAPACPTYPRLLRQLQRIHEHPPEGPCLSVMNTSVELWHSSLNHAPQPRAVPVSPLFDLVRYTFGPRYHQAGLTPGLVPLLDHLRPILGHDAPSSFCSIFLVLPLERVRHSLQRCVAGIGFIGLATTRAPPPGPHGGTMYGVVYVGFELV